MKKHECVVCWNIIKNRGNPRCTFKQEHRYHIGCAIKATQKDDRCIMCRQPMMIQRRSDRLSAKWDLKYHEWLKEYRKIN